MQVDARVAYDVWMELIADEELYRYVIAGNHRELAASRGLDEVKLAVLDELHALPGTRWNIENLRFRTALEAGSTLVSYMPRTIRMLTKGDENWLQDICFEYLSFYRWVEYGHHRFTECVRFGEYVRDRIMKRRITPAHFDVVLEFELAVIRVLMKTAHVPTDMWPTAPLLDDAALSAARLRRTVPSEVVELRTDIREWIETGDPLKGTVGAQPVTFLIFAPSLEEPHQLQVLGEGARLVLERFDGGQTMGELARALQEEFGLEESEVMSLARRWLGQRVLAVVAD